MKQKRWPILITLLLFLLAVVLYFHPLYAFRYSLAVPAAVLALGSLGVSSWVLALALLLCAVGDVMGILGNLPGQMGCFGVGHLFFILLLVRDVVSLHPRVRVWLPVVFAVSALLVVIGCTVLPAVPSLSLKVGCIVYAALLLSVFGLALMAALVGRAVCSSSLALCRRVMAAVGAGLFVFSDFVLAWNLFVGRVANAHYWIMCTYYAALVLLFVALCHSRK